MPPTAETRKPWERRRGESSLWFGRFSRYRDTPARDRSLLQLYRAETGRTTAGEPPGEWRKQMSLHRWRERAAAWDDHLEALRRAETEEATAEMGRRHAEQASAALQILSLPILAIARKMEAPAARETFLANLGALDPTALLELSVKSAHAYPQMAKVERLARGVPESTSEVTEPASPASRHNRSDDLQLLLADPSSRAALRILGERVALLRDEPAGPNGKGNGKAHRNNGNGGSHDPDGDDGEDLDGWSPEDP